MVRSVGITAVIVGLAWTGLVGAQSSSPLEKARYITVSEEGKPPQRCKVLKSWRQPNGVPVFQVQAVDTGELMTIVGTQPQGTGGHLREMTTRIFRWGRDNKPPAGAPVPPPVASAAPPSPSVSGQKKPQMGGTPTLAPQPIGPKPATAASRSNPVLQTAQKPNTIPTSVPTQLDTPPYILTDNKSVSPAGTAKPNRSGTSSPNPPQPLTPMSTPVIRYSSASTQGNNHPATLSTTDSQPRLKPLPAGSVVRQQSCSCVCPQPCNPCCKPCKPGSQSCVCDTPSPLRQPLISRLFQSKSSCSCPTVTSSPASRISVQSGGTNATKPTPAPSSAAIAAKTTDKAATEPAKPGDWRQSWGQVESWKGPNSASNKAVASHSAEKSEVASPQVGSKSAQANSAAPPDPTQAPELYHDLAMSVRPANSKIPHEGRPSAVSRLKDLIGARTTKTLPRVSPQITGTDTAKGEAEHQMNGGLPPSRVIVIPADEPNAFWSPQPPTGEQQKKTPHNAFDREPDPPPQGLPPASAGIPSNGPTRVPPIIPGIVQGPPPQAVVLKNVPCPPRAPWTPPPGPPQPMPPDTGVPDAMGNAFTLPGTRRPIPADFGGTPQEPNGFDPPVQMGDGSPPRAYGMVMPGMVMPGMYRTPMPNGMAMATQVPAAVNPIMSVPPSPSSQARAMSPAPAFASASAQPTSVPGLLAALKDSLRPSEREAAAEQLSELNWRVQPLVVESLMKAARDDPAATVRAACVHALAHMKVATPEAIALVQDLKSDRDPRVRQEAEEALNLLSDTGIQQAAHK